MNSQPIHDQKPSTSERRNFLFTRLKTFSSLSILIGVVLLLAKVEDTFNLYNAPYVLIIVGLILLLVSLLATNREKSLLCRVGLHSYKRGRRDSEIAAMYLYECERCGKKTKAASTI
jgi:hypothetical protein